MLARANPGRRGRGRLRDWPGRRRYGAGWRGRSSPGTPGTGPQPRDVMRRAMPGTPATGPGAAGCWRLARLASVNGATGHGLARHWRGPGIGRGGFETGDVLAMPGTPARIVHSYRTGRTGRNSGRNPAIVHYRIRRGRLAADGNAETLPDYAAGNGAAGAIMDAGAALRGRRGPCQGPGRGFEIGPRTGRAGRNDLAGSICKVDRTAPQPPATEGRRRCARQAPGTGTGRQGRRGGALRGRAGHDLAILARKR